MSDGERLTYLVASYNQAKYVGACVASLKAQTDDRWSAIICDDASTDDSSALVRRLIDERFLLIEQDANRGYIEALRRMIDAATTDIVAIVDADDVIVPETTESVLDAYRENSRAVFVYSRFEMCDGSLERSLGEFGKAIPRGGTAIVNGPVGHIKSFRRSAYAKTLGLDDTMLFAEDRDLIYKLEEVGPFAFVDRKLYRYRYIPDSQSNDPVKREVGFRNTRRARRAAIARRRISGVDRIAAEIAVMADYVESSQRFPKGMRSLAARCSGAAASIWRRGDMLARAGV
jgi:glycosyltransferase involved in cell wall biosynthesis